MQARALAAWSPPWAGGPTYLARIQACYAGSSLPSTAYPSKGAARARAPRSSGPPSVQDLLTPSLAGRKTRALGGLMTHCWGAIAIAVCEEVPAGLAVVVCMCAHVYVSCWRWGRTSTLTALSEQMYDPGHWTVIPTREAPGTKRGRSLPCSALFQSRGQVPVSICTTPKLAAAPAPTQALVIARRPAENEGPVLKSVPRRCVAAAATHAAIGRKVSPRPYQLARSPRPRRPKFPYVMGTPHLTCTAPAAGQGSAWSRVERRGEGCANRMNAPHR